MLPVSLGNESTKERKPLIICGSLKTALKKLNGVLFSVIVNQMQSFIVPLKLLYLIIYCQCNQKKK